MKKGAKRNQIISELLHVTDEEFTDEELIHQLIATEVTKNADKDEHMTFGQRAADAVARFAGSWAFIFSFIAVMVIWMVINLVLGSRAFDEYPFILLNLVLSCIAAVQAPLIMMSQNRQEAKDRQLVQVYDALKEKGYNPISQIVGYILSEDPTYITTHNNARSLIRKIDRDELLKAMVRTYLGE